MKPGLKSGATAEIEITVTPEMQAAFADETVHKVYSTYALVHHAEWVARKIILDYLEEHEEGMGYHVDIYHLKPTLPGMQVNLKARVKSIRNNRVTCAIEAFNSLGKIARGFVTQVIVEKDWLDKKTKEITLLNQLTQQIEPISSTKT